MPMPRLCVCVQVRMGSTTEDVVETLIRPRTRAARCRYVDLPNGVPEGHVGLPTYFVCHSWASPFHEMVSVTETTSTGTGW